MSKKIVFRSILSIVFLMVLTVAFSACNNMSGISRPNNSKGNVYLKVDVASVGRTALPDFPNVNSISDFTFTLSGKGPGASTFTALTDDPTNNPSGEYNGLSSLTSAVFPIETGEWTFKLAAAKDGTVLNSGEVSKTIGSGSNTISFELEWDDTSLDETKTGSLSFTLDFSAAPNKNDVQTVTATLVNTASDSITLSEQVILDRNDTPAVYVATYNSSTEAALGNLSAGKYRIILKLFGVDTSTNTNVLINTWTELAIITGGQTSTGSRNLTSLNEIYSITWHLDGGTSTATFPECYTRLSDTYTLPDSTAITKTDYIFGGWYTNDSFTGDPVTEIQKGTIGAQNLYAKWLQIYATVNGDPYGDKTSLINAINNGSGDLDVVLRGIVPTNELGSPGTSNTILCAISTANTKANITSISLSVAAGETIVLSGSCQARFSECEKLVSLDMTGFDTSEVVNMKKMFEGDTGLTNLDITTLDTSSVSDMSYMFSGCTSLETLDLSNLNTKKVSSFGSMFNGCTNLETLDLSSFDTTSATDITAMFGGCSSLTDLDLSNFVIGPSVMSLGELFKDCSSLTTIDISNFDTSAVIGMNSMCSGCTNLTSINLINCDLSNVMLMMNMFENCSSLTSIYVSNSFVPYSSLTASNMFDGCTNLRGGQGTEWNSGNTPKDYARIDGGTGSPGYFSTAIAKIGNTFCKNQSDAVSAIGSATGDVTITLYNGITVTDLGNAGTTGCIAGAIRTNETADSFRVIIPASVNLVLDLDHANIWYTLFYNCSKLVYADLSGLDTTNSTNMNQMFLGCSNLQELDLSSFDTSNVTDMTSMFSGCAALEKIYVSNSFKTNSVTDSSTMFSGCSSIIGGAGTTYNGSYIDVTYAKIDGGDSNPGYFSSKPIGPKPSPSAVGDIVFNDGTAIAYTPGMTLNANQKSNAIAVIFYAGPDLNNGGDTTTVRVLGTPLSKYSSSARWCTDEANAYSTKIESITCTYQYDDTLGAYIFNGDKDGRDNLNQIASELSIYSIENDTYLESKYPAFWAAKNYGSSKTNISGTAYEYGWYLPTDAELYEVYKFWKTGRLDEIVTTITGSTFGISNNNTFVSATQHAPSGQDQKMIYVQFSSSSSYVIAVDLKTQSYYICPIFQFSE